MRTNVLKSVFALVFGAVVTLFFLNGNPALLESKRVEHYLMLANFFFVCLVLYFNIKENKRLKAEIESLKR